MTRKCPECGKTYSSYPALSRKDDKTLICADCSTIQAMVAARLDPSVQERVMAMIRSVSANRM